jgi:hypothetical protein
MLFYMLLLNSRLLKIAIYLCLALAIVFAIALSVASRFAHNKIESYLISIGAKISTRNINFFTRTVSGENFEIKYSGDSVNVFPHSARIKKISLKGISLFDLIVDDKLKVHEVVIDSGNVSYNTKVKFLPSKDSSQKSFTALEFDNLILKNIKAQIISDSLTQQSGVLNVNVSGIQFHDTLKNSKARRVTFKNMVGDIRDLNFYDDDGLYLLKIAKVDANAKNRMLNIDSIMLIPLHSKFKFAKEAKKQIDRVNVFISKIKVSGLDFDELMGRKFFASRIDIYPSEVYAFRDKRMPFKEKKRKPLPMEALRKLAMEVEIDSVILKESKVTYEEFPSEGFKSGKIIFEDLQAKLNNITNRSYYNKSKYATLVASSKLLGKGLIQATFLLPIQDRLSYHAKGNISGFYVHHLNPILENLAFMRVESGKLNEMEFSFDYNDRYSSGALTINYQDLKITGLKKEKNKIISELKTFLLNTVVKNDKDKTMPVENRTGTITFERDQRRQIFNFWWKSLLSGIKNSVLNAQKRPSNK